jgi:hypothetical protein
MLRILRVLRKTITYPVFAKIQYKFQPQQQSPQQQQPGGAAEKSQASNQHGAGHTSEDTVLFFFSPSFEQDTHYLNVPLKWLQCGTWALVLQYYRRR